MPGAWQVMIIEIAVDLEKLIQRFLLFAKEIVIEKN